MTVHCDWISSYNHEVSSKCIINGHGHNILVLLYMIFFYGFNQRKDILLAVGLEELLDGGFDSLEKFGQMSVSKNDHHRKSILREGHANLWIHGNNSKFIVTKAKQVYSFCMPHSLFTTSQWLSFPMANCFDDSSRTCNTNSILFFESGIIDPWWNRSQLSIPASQSFDSVAGPILGMWQKVFFSIDFSSLWGLASHK